jgi:hypothetical protein
LLSKKKGEIAALPKGVWKKALEDATANHRKKLEENTPGAGVPRYRDTLDTLRKNVEQAKESAKKLPATLKVLEDTRAVLEYMETSIPKTGKFPSQLTARWNAFRGHESFNGDLVSRHDKIEELYASCCALRDKYEKKDTPAATTALPVVVYDPEKVTSKFLSADEAYNFFSDCQRKSDIYEITVKQLDNPDVHRYYQEFLKLFNQLTTEAREMQEEEGDDFQIDVGQLWALKNALDTIHNARTSKKSSSATGGGGGGLFPRHVEGTEDGKRLGRFVDFYLDSEKVNGKCSECEKKRLLYVENYNGGPKCRNCFDGEDGIIDVRLKDLSDVIHNYYKTKKEVLKPLAIAYKELKKMPRSNKLTMGAFLVRLFDIEYGVEQAIGKKLTMVDENDDDDKEDSSNFSSDEEGASSSKKRRVNEEEEVEEEDFQALPADYEEEEDDEDSSSSSAEEKGGFVVEDDGEEEGGGASSSSSASIKKQKKKNKRSREEDEEDNDKVSILERMMTAFERTPIVSYKTKIKAAYDRGDYKSADVYLRELETLQEVFVVQVSMDSIHWEDVPNGIYADRDLAEAKAPHQQQQHHRVISRSLPTTEKKLKK